MTPERIKEIVWLISTGSDADWRTIARDLLVERSILYGQLQDVLALFSSIPHDDRCARNYDEDCTCFRGELREILAEK